MKSFSRKKKQVFLSNFACLQKLVGIFLNKLLKIKRTLLHGQLEFVIWLKASDMIMIKLISWTG